MKIEFSTVWKTFSGFFHAMEKYFPHCGKTGPFFPRNGKTFSDFSTQWKNFFHTVENSDLGLYSGVCRCGRWHSLARRVGPRRYRPRVRPAPCGLDSALGYLGLFSGAVERSTRRPLSTVERDRPRGREKRRPPQAGSALSRSRLGCGVVARPFFLAPRSEIVALSGAKGALRAERCPTKGAVKTS